MLHSDNPTRVELEAVRRALKLGAFLLPLAQEAGITAMTLVDLLPPAKLNRAPAAILAEYGAYLQTLNLPEMFREERLPVVPAFGAELLWAYYVRFF